jgi:hypothetical protein
MSEQRAVYRSNGTTPSKWTTCKLTAERRRWIASSTKWAPGSPSTPGCGHLCRSQGAPGPKLRRWCVGRCSPGLYQAVELDVCRSPVPCCSRSSRGVAARPVSNLVSIGVRSRLVADASGAPVLRDQGPDRPAGHGKVDASLDPILTIRAVVLLYRSGRRSQSSE